MYDIPKSECCLQSIDWLLSTGLFLRPHAKPHWTSVSLFVAVAPCACSCSTFLAAVSYSPLLLWQLVMCGWDLLLSEWSEDAAAVRARVVESRMLTRTVKTWSHALWIPVGSLQRLVDSYIKKNVQFPRFGCCASIPSYIRVWREDGQDHFQSGTPV